MSIVIALLWLALPITSNTIDAKFVVALMFMPMKLGYLLNFTCRATIEIYCYITINWHLQSFATLHAIVVMLIFHALPHSMPLLWC